MDIGNLLKNKTIKSKEKTQMIANAILGGELKASEVTAFAASAKEPAKATCMEALEYVTNQRPELSSEELLLFAQNHLSAKASRLKWEAAKVIGNIAHLYPEQLDKAVIYLLENAKDEGTVVRWSAAYALTRIVTLPKYSDEAFRDKLDQICEAEEKGSIKKIYLKALN